MCSTSIEFTHIQHNLHKMPAERNVDNPDGCAHAMLQWTVTSPVWFVIHNGVEEDEGEGPVERHSEHLQSNDRWIRHPPAMVCLDILLP